MFSPTPSRQALQALSRLCHSVEFTSTTTTTRTATRCATSCTHLQSRSYHSPSLRQRCDSHQSPVQFAIRPQRTLTSTSTRRVQPSPSDETDPQNIANPALPDITNYYTLFPSTLPDGPPGSGPLTQEASPTSAQSHTQTETETQIPTPESPAFSIHLPTLRREFIRLQSQHHPDKFSTGSSAHQKALALSALINNAYKTLSDPLLRAQYLLELLYDIDVTSEDNAAHPTDQETLMEVMEAQERVEDATTQEEVDGIKDVNKERIAVTERKMGEAFEKSDVVGAKDECVRLKYWRSLQGALDEWEPGKEVRLIH